MLPDFKPHAYQESAIERVLDSRRLGLLLDPGLGKTAIMLEALRRMKEDMVADRMLVVAPLRPCYTVWPREATKWSQFAELKVTLLHGRHKEARLEEDADVYVINPEGLAWLRKRAHRWRRHPQVLAVDESTRFKRYTAVRSKHLAALLPRLQRRYILTGTPAPNGLEDLHGQIRILDGGERLRRTFTDFRSDFGFVPVPTGTGYWKWKPRDCAKDLVYGAINDIVLRLDAKDHLDLPELVTVDRRVVLPPGARAKYDQFKRDMIVSLKRGEVVAINAGVLTSKCRQLANGSVYLSDIGESTDSKARRHEHFHDAKAQALAELWQEQGGKPMLVAFEFRPDLADIQRVVKKECGFVPPAIDGRTSPQKGDALCEQWDRGELPMLLVHPVPAAHGLNLQAGGHHVCWYSIPWDLELYDQVIRRLWRQGQEAERVIVHRLVAEKTVDELVISALERKDREQVDLLDMLKEDLR